MGLRQPRHIAPIDDVTGERLEVVSRQTTTVSTVEALVAATHDPLVNSIVLEGDLNDKPSLVLLPGQSLRGVAGPTATGLVPSIAFNHGNDGVSKRAIYNDTSVDTLGRVEIRSVATIGRVQILARDKLRAGHIEIDGLDIIAAGARSENERPHDYGVDVLQGAFTLGNMQPQADVQISANLVGISVGRLGHPVLGSGVFVGGAGETGGRVNVQHLETKGIYSKGMIAAGTADQITAGVFTISGALGTSGIGFVNFGQLGELRVEAPIETFGQGARGFNVYTGTVESAQFDRIVTHGDGAVAGSIKTHGKDIDPIEQHGAIDNFHVSGGWTAVDGLGG